MVAKAKAGELHLERTVWALRHAYTGQATAIAATDTGRGEACHHGRPFAPAGPGTARA